MPRKGQATRKRVPDTTLSNPDPTGDPDLELMHRSPEYRKGQALEMLSGAKMPSKFKFRDQEVERIREMIETNLSVEKKGYRFMLMTGSPGIGKSLCANTVLGGMKVEVIKFNANTVKTVAEVQDIIAEKLLDESQKGFTCLQITRQLQEKKYSMPTVIYIEEIDLLFKSTCNVQSEDFLVLFGRKKLPIILLGISNTANALTKYSSKFNFEAKQIDQVSFSPYNLEQIGQLIRDKVSDASKQSGFKIGFSDRLFKYSSQKLEALGRGDFRVCLEFLKEVVTLALQDLKQNETEVTFGHITGVFNKMNINKDDVILRMPFQQQVLLFALYSYIKRTDALAVTVKQLRPELKSVYSALQVGEKPVTNDMIEELEQYALVSKSLNKHTQEMRISLRVSLDDVQNAFEGHNVLKRLLE